MCIRDRAEANRVDAPFIRSAEAKLDPEAYRVGYSADRASCILWASLSASMRAMSSASFLYTNGDTTDLGGPLNTGSGVGGGLSLIHISEPTRLLSISYAVFCLKKKKTRK
eukprot:TRINITY_DN6710_c0_g1_i2.p1 TRINITY_DN6710_c0_g1~~TRINITY_DN6710_c0_g1_i2.p1  ORF type:complete len:111 (-),score=25.20 TRINITY_DN6710_c0_g1_i2:100-432(-)